MLKVRENQLKALSLSQARRMQRAILASCSSRVSASAEGDADVCFEDARGYVARLQWSGAGYDLISPEQRTIRTTFDSTGRLRTLTDPLGYTVDYSYAEQGKTLRWRLDDGRVWSMTRDKMGRLVALTQPDGLVHRFERDDHGRLLRANRGSEQSIDVAYHGREGRVRHHTDPLGHKTEVAYDQDGLPATISHPDGRIERYSYQHEARQLAVGVGDLPVARFAFTEQSRLAMARYPDGLMLDFRYDEGQLVHARDNYQKLWLTHDDLGQRTGEVIESYAWGTTYRRETGASHDEVGNTVAISYGDGAAITYAWDGDGRVTTISDWNGEAINCSYGQGQLPERMEHPNGVHVAIERNASAQPTRISVTKDSERLCELGYRHDLLDRIFFMSHDSHRFSFDYDFRGRLSGVAAGRGRMQDLGVDGCGNRSACASSNGRFDAGDKVNAWGDETFEHCRQGKLEARASSAGRTDYRYDGAGRLTDVFSSGEHIAHYAYDPLGRRVLKETPREKTHFEWFGQQLLSERIVRGDGAITRRDYLYWPNTSIPLAMRVDGQVYAIHTNALGAPVLASDRSGQVVWAAHYEPFGKATVSSSIDLPLRWVGQYEDGETGLHYNLARYYDPRLGRYLTPDPLGLSGGSLNRYAYCDGDPINRADPTGLVFFLVPFVVPALKVLAAATATGSAAFGGIQAATDYLEDGEIDDYGAIAREAAVGAGVGAATPVILANLPAALTAGGAGLALSSAVGGGLSLAETCVEDALRGGALTTNDYLLGTAAGVATGPLAHAAAPLMRRLGGLWDAAKNRVSPPTPPPADVVGTAGVHHENWRIDVERKMSDGSTHSVRYDEWDRDLDLLLESGAPKQWYLPEEFAGKTVIDAPSGGNAFVRDIESMVGPDGAAMGIDIGKMSRGPGARADMMQMPFRPDSVDLMYSHYGPFTYMNRGESDQVVEGILSESYAALKPGGAMRVYPVPAGIENGQRFRRLASEAGFEVVDVGHSGAELVKPKP